MPRRPMRFARQALALQIGLIALVVAVGFALVAVLLDRTLVDQYGLRALSVARAVASDAELAHEAARRDPAGSVRVRAEQARLSTGARFIVITDRLGIRLAHPNPDQIGKPVSTDPSRVLAGHEVVDVQRGTLGLSARGRVPLRDSAGAVVGQVSVGFDARDIDRAQLRLLGTTAGFTGAALLVGIGGAALLTRGLKRRTLGLEPNELSDLVREREAVLYGIGEGVLAFDSQQRVSLANREAERLLDTNIEPGTPVHLLDLPPRLKSVLAERKQVDNLITVAAQRVLVANYRLVTRSGTDLGAVLTIRDRTELETLTRELESVRGLTDSLRAQRHEFTNRLHTLSGLLQTDRQHEAVEYLQALSSGSVAGLGPAAQSVTDPYLLAFLAAKKSAASEKQVELRLGDTSLVAGTVRDPVEVTTVVGNLVDNAVEAARAGRQRPAWVEVELLSDANTLHVSVVDSGDGVPRALENSLFDDGVTSKSGERGLGLALSRQAAGSLGGNLRLLDAGHEPGNGHGAVFHAWFPDVLDSEVAR